MPPKKKTKWVSKKIVPERFEDYDPDDYPYRCPVCGVWKPISHMGDYGMFSRSTGQVIYGIFPPVCSRACLAHLTDDIRYTD